jgi:hypothetical protein
MPDWLVVLVAALAGGFATTLVRLRHERASELRSRMLEAADEFVEAYTTAREAILAAQREVRNAASFLEEDVPADLLKKWEDQRAAAVKAAREASSALARRLPRIGLLFGVYSPADRSAFMAYATLTTATHALDVRELDEDLKTGLDEQWKSSNKQIEAFGARARDAILASPWSARPLVAKVRGWRRRLKRKLARESA